MKNKKIYDFILAEETEADQTEVSTNEKGEEVTTTKKVKKLVDRKFFIRKPNRKLFDEAELYYAVKLSEGIKAGLLTRALLQKRFSNDGGVLSEEEKEAWGDLYQEIFEKQVEIQGLSLKTSTERTDEENLKFEAANEWLRDARVRVQEFELNQSTLYDQTAENRARNKSILWWVLYLSYSIEEDEKERPYFGDGNLEERFAMYDRMEEDEKDFVIETIQKFFYFVSFWYVSKTNSRKEFEDMLKFAEQQDIGESPEPTDVAFSGENVEEELEAAEEHVLNEEAAAEEDEVTEEDKEFLEEVSEEPSEEV